MAKRKRLLWHLFSSYLLITILSLVVAVWYASTSLKHSLLKQVEADLEAKVLLVKRQFLERLNPADETSIDRLCKSLGSYGSTRFTVILPSGRVAGDSDEDPGRMDNHLDRPEVRSAIAGQLGVSTRYSATIGKQMMYVALPALDQTALLGVIRSAIPVNPVFEALTTIQLRIAVGGLIIAGFAALLSLLVSHRIRRPIQEMKAGAQAFARGDFEHRLPVPALEEMATLADALNRMAGELRERIHTIAEQRNELRAVLSSMVEGVFGVDPDERIVNMNDAASRILGCDRSRVKGQSIQEAVRNPGLQKLIRTALSREEPVEEDILFYGEEEQILNAHGTPMRDAAGGRSGVLIVLHDMTRLRRLENIRRDFVANVSHEIKTPITAIKGFVETLLDGALKTPKDAERFLGIIQKHVDRLEAIVEDLLSLSRIEKEGESEEIALQEAGMREVLAGAIQACQPKAAAKGIDVQLVCPEDLSARINPALIEQAVVNLLDNAVTCSEAGSKVGVEALEQGDEICICVRDEGCGIEKAHLDRLFERFYRVDKARSRNLGGTGLGLAIVKHIMEAHGGRTTVESEPGRGSTFTLHLPKNPRGRRPAE
ncbi:MAG: PAS domain-containing protein [Deltaproteobacteria bacterium]|nr:PAS domain-containing protein [Deltaproteobacteria bacterium]